MSTEQIDEQEMSGTKPLPEHAWLQNLVGEWEVESEMTMPDGTTCSGKGTEKVIDFGGLWALTEGKGTMPDGNTMEYRSGIGFDVTFKEYRGFWIANVSSHLWKYEGVMSQDKKTLTLNCVGPDMMSDSGTMNYRDVIELIDADHRAMTSFGQGSDGEWHKFVHAKYTRIR